jgi:cyclopropane fatty-acyl-phospholipid synthase-like methyltransferase
MDESPKSPDPRIAHWEQRYATTEYVYGTTPNLFLQSCKTHLQPGQRVLSIADGEGRNGVWLARQELQVVAIDASANAQAKARRLATDNGVNMQFIHANLLDWAWPTAAFDVVVAIFIQFLSPEERQQIFAAMKSALKPGGLLIVQGYTPKQLEYRTGGPSSIDHLYTREQLTALLDGLEILELTEHDTEIAEGSGHHGMAALIDAVARRTAI